MHDFKKREPKVELWVSNGTIQSTSRKIYQPPTFSPKIAPIVGERPTKVEMTCKVLLLLLSEHNPYSQATKFHSEDQNTAYGTLTHTRPASTNTIELQHFLLANKLLTANSRRSRNAHSHNTSKNQTQQLNTPAT